MLLKNNLEHLLLTHSKHAYKSEIKEGKSLFEIWSDEMDKKAEERAKIKKGEDIKELRKKLNNIKSKQAARRMINPILQKALFAQDLAVLYELENFLKNKYITLPEKSDKQNTQNSKPLELKNNNIHQRCMKKL
ncbi:hypothetical protein AN644_03885 [Candidatus Epulonipiscium fishelsonii]|nr:hypothetical protein AN644_03885 [Epulopiscium sp. SCG-C06WGA-EpuloA1]